MIKTLAAVFIALAFVIAVPLAVYAAPAVTRFSMDRTGSISPGQSVTFSVRATAQTNFVFAEVDGQRTQGSRVSPNSNDWTVTVHPNSTTTVTIFANRNNNESGAARIDVPVVVTGTAATTPATPTTPAPTIPTPDANLGPIAIASIQETPARAAGEVQLTVVTGREANYVWVEHSRQDNRRDTGRFAQGSIQREGAHYRVWVVNFRPTSWTAQRVEVGANRMYSWSRASIQNHDVTLAQPFVAPANPTIRNVSVSPRNVGHNATTRFTIRTNADVEYVWVVDADNREHNARRTTTTGNDRNWEVTFNPVRTGNVSVYANVTRTTTGAARRNEHLTVGTHRANIVTATAVRDQFQQSTRINVTTNRYAETVWAVLPGGQRVELSRTDSGTGNRNWQTDAWNVTTGTVVVHVTSQTGNINNLSSDNTRNVTITGTGTTGAAIHSVTPQNTTVRSGETRRITVITHQDVTHLSVLDATDVQVTQQPTSVPISGDRREWTFDIFTWGTVGTTRTLTINAQTHWGEHSSSHVNVTIIN